MIEKKDLFPIAMGTWGLGGYVERDETVDREKQIEAVRYMFDNGLNFVEVNMWYAEGAAAEIVAEGLKRSSKSRADIFVCLAVYLKDKELQDTKEEVDAFLKLFETDYIDTLQYTQSIFVNNTTEECFVELERWLSNGVTRYVSVTNENLELLQNYKKRFDDRLFSHEVTMSFEIREYDDWGVVDYAEKEKIKTVIFQPLRRNRTAMRNWPLLVELAEKYSVSQNQIIMAWLVSRGFVVLTKSESKVHIDEHLMAATTLRLDEADKKRISEWRSEGYQSPEIDWMKEIDGVRPDQLPNVFDEIFDQK